MNHQEFEKSKVYITSQIVECISNSVFNRTILEKPMGNINALSFDEKEGLPEKTSPFDAFAQIIEGKAEIIIDGTSYFMEEGECIIIPAHKSHSIKGNKCFKMILTIIKSGGYE
ncbi:cupin domain-containing protein [Chryseobacterium rhizoplanae]|uniref:cupin domain-containing protein n=1 Tax=Chryseobacterium rhizoplanae TaxID=1609531 RepID=UPI001CE28E7D|nr:cupin domain-containing protein [Chryseobacterium rhizoplanae]UCA61149.1 cupin domain-containing protein [Chryseobacterium rhizoplanae]